VSHCDVILHLPKVIHLCILKLLREQQNIYWLTNICKAIQSHNLECVFNKNFGIYVTYGLKLLKCYMQFLFVGKLNKTIIIRDDYKTNDFLVAVCLIYISFVSQIIEGSYSIQLESSGLPCGILPSQCHSQQSARFCNNTARRLCYQCSWRLLQTNWWLKVIFTF